jgi:predicted nucleotidyltransferase
MERDEAISRLQQHEADLKRLGVERLYMFGSTARGEASHDSDVDLFFDYQKGELGVFELMDVKEFAAKKARNREIPWQKVAGIGNVLRHDYESIAAPVIWKLLQADLPTLEKACRAELASEEGREHR